MRVVIDSAMGFLWKMAYEFREEPGCSLSEWRGINEFLEWLEEQMGVYNGD